jgi:four helix bundle protein
MSDQIWRCGTAVGSNYRATCRSRSAKEFIARIGVVIEEADETAYWLEVIVESNMLRATLLKSLMMEARELLHIFSKSQSTARINLAKTKKKPKGTP